ncbi:MAG TPA: hypothetical protein VHC45_10345 [Gaiellaceae bacterium]|nr:hypothetical protein [Gaiellaceae bacterium]
MEHYDRLRWLAVALLVGAAVFSALGNGHQSPVLRALALACFLGAAFAFAGWRRAGRAHRARFREQAVFDREAKTSDETRTGPDR